MWIKRVILKHHGDIALVRLQIGDVVAIEGDLAAARPLKPGNASKRGTLSAAAWSEQCQQLAILDPDVEAIDRAHLAEFLCKSLKSDTCHDRLPIP